ncbi:MAG: hypothetical protein ABI835_16190 [Chloroflexota bacterium]
MAYLNQQEREKLLDELTRMSIGKARGKLRRMDAKGKIAFMRNAQSPGEYVTRYDLHGLGTVVTLVEREGEAAVTKDLAGSASVRSKPEFRLAEVTVEPMPENRT